MDGKSKCVLKGGYVSCRNHNYRLDVRWLFMPLFSLDSISPTFSLLKGVLEVSGLAGGDSELLM